MIGEGRIVFAGETNHSHEMEFAPLGVFISDTVEKLNKEKHIYINSLWARGRVHHVLVTSQLEGTFLEYKQALKLTLHL